MEKLDNEAGCLEQFGGERQEKTEGRRKHKTMGMIIWGKEEVSRHTTREV